jgi:nicotinamide riboside kinase
MKIGLTGTMSIGKSTLVNALQDIPQFQNYHFATERSKYLRDLGIPLNTDSTLKGQTVFLAERCAELIYDNLITDRTIIDVIAFTKSAKSINILDKDNFEQYASVFLKEYDYIFYISPEGLPIENNNVRETNPEYRQLIDMNILSIIHKYHHQFKNIHTIGGTTEERIQQILNVVNS